MRSGVIQIRKSVIAILAISLIPSAILTGQVIRLNSNQSRPLIADAGKDTLLVSGSTSRIGGNPSAVDGYGAYLYLWTPSAGLDDPAKANPVAAPSATTTYLLSVTDQNNCTAQDEVRVTVSSSGIHNMSTLTDFSIFPNPSGGNLTIILNGNPGSLLLRVINSTGNIALEINQEISTAFTSELETRRLPRGTYFVMAIVNGRVITKPIMLL